MMPAAMSRCPAQSGCSPDAGGSGGPAALAGALFLFVGCTLGAPNAFGDLNDCDWTVTSEAGDKAGRTQEEVEAELVRQLAIKLRQFDRCLGQQNASAAGPASDSASHAAGTARTDVATGGGGGQNPGDGAGQTRPDTGAPGQMGNPMAAAGDEAGTDGAGASRGTPGRPGTPGTVASASGADRTGVPGMPGGQERGRDSVVEDDVARILREAAEKESDPTRRAALWKEYENYVKNL